MKIVAHRGISSLAPENTLAAFTKAAELGCEWIEFDVQLCADMIPVVIHDKTVERCTNGEGTVSSMTLQELQRLDAGSWFDTAFCEETIPSLEEVLLFAQDKGISTNIELKIFPEDNISSLCKKVAEVITKRNIDPSRILLSSFENEALSIMRALLPQIRRGQLWRKIPHDPFPILQELEAYSVHCNQLYLKEQQAKQILDKGYELYCYTVNDPKTAAKLKEWGVKMVFSDNPQLL